MIAADKKENKLKSATDLNDNIHNIDTQLLIISITINFGWEN